MGAGSGGVLAQETVPANAADDARFFALKAAPFCNQLHRYDNADQKGKSRDDDCLKKLVQSERCYKVTVNHGVGSFPSVAESCGGSSNKRCSSIIMDAGTVSKIGCSGAGTIAGSKRRGRF